MEQNYKETITENYVDELIEERITVRELFVDYIVYKCILSIEYMIDLIRRSIENSKVAF